MQKEEQKKESEDSLLCPSFSTYSSDKLAYIADQVTRNHSLPQNDSDIDLYDNDGEPNHQNDDSDFEFVAFRKTADGVFFDRNDGPVFPIFNRDLAGTPPECDGGGKGGRISGAEEIRFSMEKLLIGNEEEDRRSRLNPPPSSSSSEVDDELDANPAGTYCVWAPNPVRASPNRCKKSNSTGSSSSPAKRWKLLDLLRRSKSDGKDSFVFLTPSSSSSSSSSSSLGFGSGKKEKEKKKKEEEEGANANVKSKEKRGGGSERNRSGGGDVAGKRSPAVSAHEALYVRNREMRRVDKRRSYLPYKQDLVGFCAALNGMGRTFAPF